MNYNLTKYIEKYSFRNIDNEIITRVYVFTRKKEERKLLEVHKDVMEKIASLNLPSSSFYNRKGGNMVDNMLPSYRQYVTSLLEIENVES